MSKRKPKLQTVPPELVADPEGVARAAARGLRRITGIKKFNLCVVFGTGWDRAARTLGRKLFDFPATQLPGFLPPTVKGHAGRICGYRIKGQYILVFRGRKHLYEFKFGQGMEAVLHYVRMARAAGCTTLIHTNAVGATRPGLKVGQIVVVSDFNKFVSFVPPALRGANFLACPNMFSRRLRRLCRQVDRTLTEGVLAQVPGPDLETRAEAAYLFRNGIDVVGMSMIPEAVMARRLGMGFLGVSLVTDPAGEKITHPQVMAIVHRRAPQLGEFIKRVIERK